MVTVKDIAEYCKVSSATVSKALNGYGDISPATADRIRQAARELHYLPNVAARQLKTNNSHSIGLLFEDHTGSGLTHEFFSKILNAAKNEAEHSGYDVTFISRNLGGKLTSYLEHARYRRLDGVLIASADFESRSVEELVQSEIPTITIDYSFNDQSSVMSDNVEGSYALTRYVIEMGHRKIGFIHGEDTSVTRKRMVGFNRALTEEGITVPEEYIIEAAYHSPDSCREATRKLMELRDPPTVILFPDDYSYIGGLMELERMHVKIPLDVSVVGYDGIGLSQYLHPVLTTYHQDSEEMGRISMRKLIESIEHPKTCEAETLNVKGKLLIGHTVRKIS
ncbi:MAG: LacI family DNA-binding transcriptional regulator [Lachnospiraceae bacterium]|nr:LacI family DNA-binding transcriptional regulator [Lachnospiraceae bacterium]